MNTLNRRHFLRGIGTAVAIPALEAAMPARAAAAAAQGLATTATGAPLRTAFIYFPNGAILEHWNPTGRISGYGNSWKRRGRNPYHNSDSNPSTIACSNFQDRGSTYPSGKCFGCIRNSRGL